MATFPAEPVLTLVSSASYSRNGEGMAQKAPGASSPWPGSSDMVT